MPNCIYCADEPFPGTTACPFCAPPRLTCGACGQQQSEPTNSCSNCGTTRQDAVNDESAGTSRRNGDSSHLPLAESNDEVRGSSPARYVRPEDISAAATAGGSVWGTRIAIGATLVLVFGIAGSCLGSDSKSELCADMYGSWYHYTNDDGGYCTHTLNGDRRPF